MFSERRELSSQNSGVLFSQGVAILTPSMLRVAGLTAGLAVTHSTQEAKSILQNTMEVLNSCLAFEKIVPRFLTPCKGLLLPDPHEVVV